MDHDAWEIYDAPYHGTSWTGKRPRRPRETVETPPPTSLTIDDAARAIGIKPNAVRKRIAAGSIRAVMTPAGLRVLPPFVPRGKWGTRRARDAGNGG